MIDTIMQIGLAVFGLTAIALMAIGRPPWLWLGCLIGLLGQVFWFYTATHPMQFGLLIVTFAYTTIYALGVIGHRPRRRSPK